MPHVAKRQPSDWRDHSPQLRFGPRGSACWYFEPRADVKRHFLWIEINEVAYLMVRNAPQLRPSPERADGRLLAFGKNPSAAESVNISELAIDRCDYLRVHALACASTQRPA